MDATFTSTTSPTPDALLGGEMPRVAQAITLLSGENLTRGAVMGKITNAGATAAAAAGNTGNGTISAITVAAGVKVGVYKAVCVEPAVNLGRFIVEDPDGIIVGTVNVGSAFAGVVGFTISDGAADFVAGDAFDITVAAGSGKYKRAVAAATDGSQRPVGILIEDTDASAGDKAAAIYRTGEFNEAGLNFGAGHDANSVRAALEALQIYLKTALAA